jgi:hypothetical protein
MLNKDYSRCLAHAINGKANGCDKRDDCARHVALRSDQDEQTIVTTRVCSQELDYFIPLDYGR